MKKITHLVLFLFIAGVFVTGGCQTAKKPVAPEKKTSPSQVTESDKRVMANRFSTIAQGVEGVSKATVVIASADTSARETSTSAGTSKGKIVVMVGLTLDAGSNTSKGKQQAVMSTVKKRIMANDKRVTDVLVTADANMVKKINDIAAGLIEGKPVLSYAKNAAELGKMMKKQGK